MKAWRVVLVVVVVLGGLFVAADRVAVSVAQKKAAEKAQAAEGLSSRPKVSIKGFPFLTQVASSELDHVAISADGVSVSSAGSTVQARDFHADLYDVKLSRDFDSAVAARATGGAVITYAELTQAAPKGVTVTAPGTSATDEVRLTLTFMGAHVSVLSRISVQDPATDTVRLRMEDVPKEISGLGLEDELRSYVDFSPQLAHLPEGLHLQSVTTGTDGAAVRFTGTGVRLVG
ncbi:LmeA family phospholipid-binding protein [Actinacidiphila yeochonensis]|uniref:LmeA family phospholipid-binding protein n=1 Tax=Actinacidiphila yeochonensis TaxID=89050 RepID=UPI000566E19D|nr:DUF2993 domain-containing protein [Actinacidiphila yeochonensis]